MKNFLTQYEKDGDFYAGQNICASSWEEAQKVANERGLKEIVIGYL
jgi:hypothetical protein